MYYIYRYIILGETKLADTPLTEEGLARALQKLAKGSSGNNNSNNSVDITGPLGAFKNAVNNAGGSLTDFSKGVASSVKGLGILGKTLGGVTAVIGYLEETQSQFNSLSKVGAGLNGNLSDLRVSAARTRLPLDKFSRIVSDNVTELAGFAGGVEGGTRKVAALGKELFATRENGTQLIEGFMNLGYTIEEANEFVVKNTSLMRRRQLVEGLTDAQSVQAAQELAKQMDIVSKLTGKDAKSQMDDMTARMRNGSTDSKLRLLEKQGITTARAAYEKSTAALQKSPAVVRDLLADLVQTGAPMTAATRNFTALNTEAASLLTKAANATKAGDVEGAQRYAEEAARATVKSADSVQNLTIGTYGQISEIAQGQANVLQEVAPIIDAVAAHTKKMESELERTVSFTESFNNMLGGMITAQGNQVAGKGAGQEALVALNESQQALANVASAVNEAIAKELNNSLVVGALNALTEQMQKITPEGFEEIVKTVAAIFPGASNAELAREAATVGAISPADAALLTEMEDAATSQARKDEIKTDLQSRGILNAEGTIDVRIVEDMTNRRRESAKAKPIKPENEGASPVRRWFGEMFDNVFREEGGPVVKNEPYIVGEKRPEVFVPNSNGNIFPNTDMLADIIPSIKKITSRIPAAMQQAQTGVPVTQAEKMAAAMGNSGGGGATIEELLQTSNDLLLAMLGVNTTQARNGEKLVRNARGAGNLMNGIG